MLESLVTDTAGETQSTSNQVVQNYMNFHFLSSEASSGRVFFLFVFLSTEVDLTLSFCLFTVCNQMTVIHTGLNGAKETV